MSALPLSPRQRYPSGNCTVSVINLTSNTVTATIPITGEQPDRSKPSPATPTTSPSPPGTPTGKKSTSTSPESIFMTVIRTADTDTFLTTIPLQGAGIGVRVTQP